MSMEYVLNRVFEHFSLNSSPKVTVISKKELVDKAWADTGKHLRKALNTNAKVSKRRSRSSK